MPKAKAGVAFILGVFSFFLFMFIAETLMYHYGNAGLFVAFVVMFVYFFACQFFLSRGNPNAYRKDWPIMLALDGIYLPVLIAMVLSERREVVIAQGLGILIGCFGATWAGAFVASKRARRKGEQT